MAPRVHLVRHAQGFHNLSVANHAIHDPLLTPAGIEQCKILSSMFPYISDIDLVVASPLKRTMYTALYSFSGPIEKKHLKVIALPELQETSDLPCDTGSDPTQLAKELDGKPIDLSELDKSEAQHWNNKRGRWAPHSDAIVARAKVAREWLRARPERDIVVVTHGGFLHYFTEDWTDAARFAGKSHEAVSKAPSFHPHHGLGEFDLLINNRHAGTGWANTEFRSYNFASASEATLVETPESLTRRQGTEKSLNKAEQKNLQQTTTPRVEEQGHPRRQEEQSISQNQKSKDATSVLHTNDPRSPKSAGSPAKP